MKSYQRTPKTPEQDTENRSEDDKIARFRSNVVTSKLRLCGTENNEINRAQKHKKLRSTIPRLRLNIIEKKI